MDRSFIEQIVREMDPFAVLNVTSFCDQRCVFCSEGVREKKPAPSTETVKSIIDGLIDDQGIKCVLFMGGEITLRRDFLELARYVVERGLRLNIATNGLRFAREQFARDALAFIDGMEVSFHAHTAELARAITGRDRFDDLLQAVHNICAIKPDVQITFNIVLNRLNLPHLLETTRLVSQFDLPYAAMIHYKYIKVAGRVLDEPSLVPSYTELEGPLTEAMQFCIDRDIHYLFEGVPYCIIPGYLSGAADAIGGLHDSTFYSMNRELLSGDEDPLDYELTKQVSHYPPPCALCDFKGTCPGIRVGYQRFFGCGEVGALKLGDAPGGGVEAAGAKGRAGH